MLYDNSEKIDNLIKNMNLIKLEDIPNIDLYMDQVTTFMEEHLGSQKRQDEDKILTKTMINNYAKNDLLPSPDKKKYSRDHMILLTYIYYFKSFLTIGDIKTITSELSEKYFHSEEEIKLPDIYNEMVHVFDDVLANYKKSVSETSALAEKCAKELDTDDEYLAKYFLISLLGLDVYMKKQLIESMIDDMSKKEV